MAEISGKSATRTVKTHIMDHVASIEELGNSEVNVVRGGGPSAILGLEPIGMVEV